MIYKKKLKLAQEKTNYQESGQPCPYLVYFTVAENLYDIRFYPTPLTLTARTLRPQVQWGLGVKNNVSLF